MLEMPRPCTLSPTMRPFSSDSGSRFATMRKSALVPVKLVSVWPLKPRLRPVPSPLSDADGIRAVGLDVLPHRLDAVPFEPGEDEFGDRLFLPRRARNAGEVAAELRQLVAIDLRKDFLCGFLIE